MTTISEIAPDVFSICTYIEQIDLQFRQFLIRDEQPLLYHTGTRRMFERVRDAVGQVMDPSTLRWIAFSHFEADECGALNYWLQEARDAQAACSANGALVSVDDFAFGKARPPARELAADVLCGYLRALAPYLRPLATSEAADRAAEAYQLAGLAPLRPWVAFVTEDSGRRSAEALTRTPGNLPPLPATVVSIDEDKIDG